MKLILFAIFAAAVSAYVVPSKSARMPSTQLYENFGLGIGEDTYANQLPALGGEANYKQFVNRVKEDNMLNRKYNAIRRVRELNLLSATAENGVLSKLEAQGLDLAAIEKLLPVLDEAGVLGLAGSNQQLLVNLVAPLLVEGAPFLLPITASAIAAGPGAFYAAAAAFAGLESFFVANDVELPLIGLPAAGVLGLLLVPLTVVSAGLGVALGSLKK